MCHLDCFLFPSIMVEASNLPPYLEGTLRSDRGAGDVAQWQDTYLLHIKVLGLIPRNLGIILQKHVGAWGALRWFRRDHYPQACGFTGDHYPRACGCMERLKVVRKGSLSKSV